MKRHDINNYGGAMANYADVVDPTVDEDAKFRNICVNDVGMMTNTACQAIYSFVTANGANPSDPTSGHVHGATWGGDSVVKPTIARGGEGIWNITAPSVVDTPLTPEDEAKGGGVQETVVFRRALAQVESSDGTFYQALAKVTGANAVRVYTYLGTTLDDIPGQIVTVWIW